MIEQSPFDRARTALDGLSVADAFGECLFHIPSGYLDEVIATRSIQPGPWAYTDDTQMALSIVAILRRHGTIDQEQLARSFANRYEVIRGYGPAMQRALPRIRAGEAWRLVSRELYGGQGSFGNGAAMRVAPIGAYFADNLHQVVDQAALSAEVTHAHPEAVAGAIAVAVAAALAWQHRASRPRPSPPEFLDNVLSYLPSSEVARRTAQARALHFDTSIWPIVDVLGNGSRVSAQDTVPFVLWCAAQRLDSYEEAIWLTASGLGDVDTTSAMVGGIVALSTGDAAIPTEWQDAREPLPHWPFLGDE
jgi:ADP-ribosylglycohydrolase